MRTPKTNARTWVLSALAIGILLVVIVGGWTFYDLWQAEALPWQPDPTRVVVTPFADLPIPAGTPSS